MPKDWCGRWRRKRAKVSRSPSSILWKSGCKDSRRRTAPDLFETLMAIGRRCGALPDLDTRSAEEILGYDGIGAFR